MSPLPWFDLRASQMTLRPTTCESEVRLRSSSRKPGGRLMPYYIGAQGRGVEVPLGEGSVDFPEILGILEQSNYGGYFAVERESAQQPLPELRQAIDYLRGL